MVEITADQVKKLRELTNAGIMECKNALIKSKGNIKKAITNVCMSNKSKIKKIYNKKLTKGLIDIKIIKNFKYGSIIELNCETDFVSKNKEFTTLSEEIVFFAVNKKIFDLNLLKDIFKKKINELILKTKENINLRRLITLNGSNLNFYLHYNKIGVIVDTDNSDMKLSKHIAMQIAACNPKYIKSDDIPSEIIKNEYQIYLNNAIKLGKSIEIAKKIADSRIKKFTEELSLIEQNFIIDPNKKISQLLIEKSTKINNFVRFEIGEII